MHIDPNEGDRGAASDLSLDFQRQQPVMAVPGGIRCQWGSRDVKSMLLDPRVGCNLVVAWLPKR